MSPDTPQTKINELTSVEKSFYLSSVRDLASPLVVTGPSRGGTSLIAALFRSMGFHMGSYLVENQEDSEFVDAFYPNLSLDKFEQRVAARSASHMRWGFKLPKTTMFLNEILPLLNNPTFVFVYRNPMAAAMGEHHRGTELHDSLYFSAMFYERLSGFVREQAQSHNFVLCNYELIAENPLPFAQAMCKAFDIAYTPEMQAQIQQINTGVGGGYVSF